jgi:hypothetical protein
MPTGLGVQHCECSTVKRSWMKADAPSLLPLHDTVTFGEGLLDLNS